MESIIVNTSTKLEAAEALYALGGIEIANHFILQGKKFKDELNMRQGQFMKWKYTKALHESLADYRLPLRLIKFDMKEEYGGYPVIENGDVKPDFDTEAFIEILNEIAELNKDLKKSRNGNTAFFRAHKMELTKRLLEMLDVYCLPLQLVSRKSLAEI